MDGWERLYAEDTPTGSLELFTPGPKLVLSVAKGHLEEQYIPMVRKIDELIARDGEVTIFHDWLEVTGYETRVRTEWTKWSSGQADGVESTHILVRSRIVAMGVRTAALALALVGSRLNSYTEPEAFDEQLIKYGVREPLRACS